MVTNKRPREEFERGEEDFIEWIRMHYPGNAHKVIDERMKKTGNDITVDQAAAAEAIGLGLMCSDLSRERKPSFDFIHSIISKLSDCKRSHGDTAI